MSDPAVEAARRAWGFGTKDSFLAGTVGGLTVEAAREALKPLRDLHRKSPVYYPAEDCLICSSDDDSVSEQHYAMESADGSEWLCTAVIDSYCCRHCTEIQGYNGDDPVVWPCESAKYIYPDEELS